LKGANDVTDHVSDLFEKSSHLGNLNDPKSNPSMLEVSQQHCWLFTAMPQEKSRIKPLDED
jgi:hypothetical protein